MQVLSFREFEGVSKLVNSYLRLKMTCLFIEKGLREGEHHIQEITCYGYVT